MATPLTAAAQAADEAAHEAAGAFPPFDFAFFPSQLFWLAVSFGTLYVLMSRVALPRVAGILEARRARIAKDLDDASAFQARADGAGKAYEKSLAEAKFRAQTLAQEARDRLASEAEMERKALEAELNTKLAAAEAQITQTKSKAMSNVADIARDIAGIIIQHLMGKPADPTAIARAIDALKRH